jgi:hypothetical protein
MLSEDHQQISGRLSLGLVLLKSVQDALQACLHWKVKE